jgi:hypothetical protein
MLWRWQAGKMQIKYTELLHNIIFVLLHKFPQECQLALLFNYILSGVHTSEKLICPQMCGKFKQWLNKKHSKYWAATLGMWHSKALHWRASGKMCLYLWSWNGNRIADWPLRLRWHLHVMGPSWIMLHTDNMNRKRNSPTAYSVNVPTIYSGQRIKISWALHGWSWNVSPKSNTIRISTNLYPA